jgi:hypothetical protein
MTRFEGEVCDFCKSEGKLVLAVRSARWEDDPDADPLSLCQEHLDMSRGEPQPRVECPFCGSSSKNERALQSHISRTHRQERDAQRSGVAITAVSQ